MGGRFRRRRRRSCLNPYASEFHPSFLYSFYSSSTSASTSTNNNSISYYQNYTYYHPNNNHLNFHYNSVVQHPLNYQNYPYHHHQGFIFPHHQPSPINPMQLGQLPTAPPSAQAHFSPAHNLNVCGGVGVGVGRGRSRSRSRDSVINNNNNERKKQGFIYDNNNNNNKNNDGRSNLRGGGGERIVIREKTVFMAVKPNGSETTAMIRNIPNQYTREMLIKFLDEFCRIENQRLSSNYNDTRPPLAYDFLYLPIDFMRGANKGYAFVNFTNSVAVWKLHLACSDQPWSQCNSPKICKINYASIQGKESLMKHFGESRFICDHEEYLPISFSPPRDGSGASVVETTIGTRFPSSHPRNQLFV